jgi:hypothetical protein
MVTDNKIHKILYKNWCHPEKYSKFTNRHLNVATIHYPPAVILPNEGNDVALQSADGIEPKLLTMLSEYLNFTFKYNQSADEDLWGGIHRLLIEKKADVAIGDNYMFADRPYELSIPYNFTSSITKELFYPHQSHTLNERHLSILFPLSFGS